jgi:hypothetical protein
MKSLESRIEKLEKHLEFNNQNEIVVIVRNFSFGPCAQKYPVCPYIENEEIYGPCPLYEGKYQEAKQRNEPGFLTFDLPCFKEGECPLCLEDPVTPTGKGDRRNKNHKRKDD